MKNDKRILVVATLTLALLVSQPTIAGTNGAAAFDQVKALVGHWQTESTNRQQATLDLDLTSGGTALIEKFRTVEGGKEVEMITLYYLDGDHLKLTHYCMAGNQPTMRATYAPDAKTLTFNFESASNLKSPNDGHMHSAIYTFLDNDHFKTHWTYLKNQKPEFTEEVTYVRVK